MVIIKSIIDDYVEELYFCLYKGVYMRKLLVFSVLTVFVVILVVSYLVINSSNTTNGNVFRIEWQSSDIESADKNEAGIFEIKAALITPEKALFFYTIQTKEIGSPNINVLSINPTKNSSSVFNDAKIQSLGKMNNSDTGVIEVKLDNIPGQIISLQATLPGAITPTWKTTPLKQINPLNTNAEPITFIPFVPQFTPVAVEADSVGGENIAVLKYYTTDASAQAQYLRIDRQKGLVKLTQADYNKLVASKPIQQPQNNNALPNAPIATPAPVLPTPTLRS